MKHILIAVYILFSINLFGQNNKAENVIEMNSKFTIELQTKDYIKIYIQNNI